MIFQNDKTPFFDIKRKSLEIRKIDIFPNQLTHGFGPKMVISPTFFFQAIQARKMSFYDILQGKKAFLGYNNKKFKQSKIDIFQKGLTHRSGPKMAIFPFVFFHAIQARKMSFMIFSNEKTPFQAIETTISKHRKIDIFLNGLTHSFGPKMAIIPTFFFQAIQARKMSFMLFQNEKTPF